VDSRGAREPADHPQAGERAGRGVRHARSGRAIPFRPGNGFGASIVPSDIQLDIFAFLPVPPQNYGSDVQFQMPPVHSVFLALQGRSGRSVCHGLGLS